MLILWPGDSQEHIDYDNIPSVRSSRSKAIPPNDDGPHSALDMGVSHFVRLESSLCSRRRTIKPGESIREITGARSQACAYVINDAISSSDLCLDALHSAAGG